ncbi:hypothetical protein J2X97_001664 [Epilithonimonas hungarica]|uniref:hypothetical protein n=1 Tax=Epilithonimonas hungarica TaxID=454006 RepID=UPI002784BA14|nr:hypothetical protein [Epilithonimonas hungarica]MDP9956027.1 hypothetical protein [Epilithonimonas hungarica]
MNLLKSLLTYLYDNEDQAGHSDPDKMDRPSFSDNRSMIDSDSNNDDDKATFCRDYSDSELLDRTTLPRMDNFKRQ